MAKIWQKDYELDSLVEEFTVGRDYVLDLKLVAADCLGSLAHGRMLESIGILSGEEFSSLKSGLCRIIEEHGKGAFPISRSQEDCHTAIEERLTTLLGDAGKKIHTGRSRNDQVLLALRLYGRSYILSLMDDGLSLAKSLLAFARRHESVPMPGRTHMQIAMPSSVGLWAASWAEAVLDIMGLLSSVYGLWNQCPLGAAASYGVPLPLDREMVAELLGFPRLQNNVLYANNSRGAFEAVLLDTLDHLGIVLGKCAEDLILFSMPEFGYFSLPDRLCSGSSIMPQKKNPDGLELVRAKSASLSACSFRVKSIIRSLPSGYNRDFQETKEPFLSGLSIAASCTRIMRLTIDELEVNHEALKKGFTPDIFATDAALDLVRGGLSFRDAYREVGLNLKALSKRDPEEAIKSRTASGTPGNLRLDVPDAAYTGLSAFAASEGDRIRERLTALAGFPVTVC